MSILSFIENKLGSLHNWPQDILRYIFYVRPTNYTTIEIAAFFFGNKIPRDTALELFQEYNHPSSRHIELLCERYETWQLRTEFKHMAFYYNMNLGRIVYTGCPRRNVQYFGRVFLMLNYTDITQNTYIQS